MAVSVAKYASSSTSGTPLDASREATIDLRVADAKWELRQLQARVLDSRQRLAEVESRLGNSSTALEARLGDGIVEAQNQVALERADARRAAAVLMADAELESRRRLEVAQEEAHALRVVAQWLRSHAPGYEMSESGARPVSGADAPTTPADQTSED